MEKDVKDFISDWWLTRGIDERIKQQALPEGFAVVRVADARRLGLKSST